MWILVKGNFVYYLPFRFTGKPLDEETGYYYFGARYYNPRLSVWLTSDPAMSDYFSDTQKGEGGVFNFVNLNAYHYGGNNPVKYKDDEGEWIHIAIGAAIGGIVGGAVSVISQKITTGKVDWKQVGIDAVAGAVSGGILAGTGNGVLAGAVGNAVSNGLTQNEAIKSGKQDSFDYTDFAVDTFFGAATGLIHGPKVQGINVGRNSMTAITKSTMTKLSNKTISNVSMKTSAKIAVSRLWNGAFTIGTSSGKVFGETLKESLVYGIKEFTDSCSLEIKDFNIL